MRFIPLFVVAAVALFACTPGKTEPAPIEQPPAEGLSPAEEVAQPAPIPSETIEPALPKPPLNVKLSVVRDPVGAMGISELRVLTVRAEITGADPGELALELLAPSDLPYEKRVSPLKGTAFDTQVVEFAVPVAGTMIDKERLSGHWAANFYLDGQVVAAESIELAP